MDHDWNAIVEDLGPKFFRYFRARFSHEQSSDLTQETLIRLLQKTNNGDFDPTRGNMRMYAYGIAHFVALEAHKSPSMREAPPDLHLAAQFEEELMERQKKEQMRRALRKLEPVQVQIISLMIDEEMTLADIGKLLNMPTGTVKSHVHRAKVQLHNILTVKESV